MHGRLYPLPEAEIDSLTADHPKLEAALFNEDGAERSVDIGAGWQMLHFIFTGRYLPQDTQPGPLSFLAVGSRTFKAKERVLSLHAIAPADVTTAAEQLAKISAERVDERYRQLFNTMVEHRLFNMTCSPDDDIAECVQGLTRMQPLFAAAAERGEAMLIAYG